MECPNCNAHIFEGDRFCGECGTDVSAATGQQTDIGNVNMESGTEQPQPGVSAGKDDRYIKTGLTFFRDVILRMGTMSVAERYTHLMPTINYRYFKVGYLFFLCNITVKVRRMFLTNVLSAL